MAEPLNPVVVPREACLRDLLGRVMCEKGVRCQGCLGDGTRAVLDQAQEVERPVGRMANYAASECYVEVDR